MIDIQLTELDLSLEVVEIDEYQAVLDEHSTIGLQGPLNVELDAMPLEFGYLDLDLIGFPYHGLNAYQLAVQEGFVGTLPEWLESLRGPTGDMNPDVDAAVLAALAAVEAALAHAQAALGYSTTASSHADEAGVYADASLTLRTQAQAFRDETGQLAQSVAILTQTAEAYVTAAGEFASAAIIAQVAAETSRAQALISQTAAAHSETTLTSAAATASENATMAVNARNEADAFAAAALLSESTVSAYSDDASNFASAANMSSITASAARDEAQIAAEATVLHREFVDVRATDAEQFAQAADEHRLAAATSAGNAFTSETNSAISEQNADGARVLAESARDTAVDMANAAGDSAEAALHSEEQAAIFADESGVIYGVVASRVDTVEAQLANTEGSGLSVRIENEETARVDGDSALGLRSTTLESYAGNLIAATVVTTFEQNGLFWRSAAQYAPNNPSFWPPDPSTTTYPVVAGIGKVMSVNASSAYQERTLNAVLPLIAGHRLRVAARVRQTTGTLGTIYLYNIGLTDAFLQAFGYSASAYTFTTYNAWHLFELEFDTDTLIAGGSACWRPLLAFPSTPGATYQIEFVEWEDITEVTAANARITSEELTRASADSVLASRATVIEAKLIVGQNLIRNPSGDEGLLTGGWGTDYTNDWFITSDPTGNAKIRQVGIGATSGNRNFYQGISTNAHQALAWAFDYNISAGSAAAASWAGYGPDGWVNAYSDALICDGTWRRATLLIPAALAGTSTTSYPGITITLANGYAAFRRAKLEYGLQATPYTDERAVQVQDARITSEESARIAADGVLASRSTALEAQMANTSGSGLQSRIATEEAARVTADTALATRSTTLEARVTTVSDFLNRNARFDEWTSPTGPLDRANYDEANLAGNILRVAGENGGYAMQMTGPVGSACYMGQITPYGVVNDEGWYVLEADVRLDAGTFTAAGVYAHARGPSGDINHQYLVFATEPDQSGIAPGFGTIGRTYRFRKLVQLTAITDHTAFVLYCMAHWSGFADQSVANQLTWFKCGIRPATASEIELRQARSGSTSVSARITTEETARATADSALATRTTTLEARNITTALNLNAGFDNYPSAAIGVPPANWTHWTGSIDYYRVLDNQGGYSVVIPASGNDNAGLYQYSENGTLAPNTYYVQEVEAELLSGNWNGSGVYVEVHTAAAGLYNVTPRMSFASMADANGIISSTKAGRRTWTQLWTTDANAGTSRVLQYLMTNWSGHTGWAGASSSIIKWHRCAVRPATAQEIAAGVALPALASRVTTTESVALDAQGRSFALRETVLDVNGYVSGTRSVNNGTSSSFEVLASVFGIRDPSAGERTEYRQGIWYIYSPTNSTRTMYGKAFGGAEKLVWWTGPSAIAEGAETKANAYVFMSQIAPRFGGSDTTSSSFEVGISGPNEYTGVGITAGNRTTTTSTLIVSGNTGTVSYNWVRSFGDNTIVANTPNTIGTSFTTYLAPGQLKQAIFTWTATDAGSGKIRSGLLTVSMYMDDGSGGGA
jgi:hypothetical protein